MTQTPEQIYQERLKRWREHYGNPANRPEGMTDLQWHMEEFMHKPNKPGYQFANNH